MNKVCFAIWLLASVSFAKTPRNLILIVGDGMGTQQISFLDLYLKEFPSNRSPSQFKKLTQDGATFLLETAPFEGIVADSASSATQIASGKYTMPGFLGLDHHGKPMPTIIERAAQAGIATGLVSDTRITHATPAAFTTHSRERYNEGLLAEQMLESGADLFLSGGLQYFLPQEINQKGSNSYREYSRTLPKELLVSKREDSKDLLALSKEKGYKFIHKYSELRSVPGGKYLGLFQASSMPNAFDERKNLSKKSEIPTLEQLTTESLRILSQDKDGFFLMVEGGQIDWASHSNDPGYLLAQMVQLNEVIAIALKWASARDDTLVLVTSDHETGSFSFSNTFNSKNAVRKIDGKDYKQKEDWGDARRFGKLLDQTRTCYDIMRDFYKFPDKEQTPKKLSEMVEKFYPFAFSEKDAKRVVESSSLDDFRKIRQLEDSDSFFADYYNYKSHRQCSVMSKIIFRSSNIIWGTAGHTSTPVLSYAFGPKVFTKPFTGIMHNTKLGTEMFHFLGLKQ